MTTKGNADVRDITAHVEDIVSRSGIRNGIVNVSGKGSTLGITTIEFEPGAVSDLRRALDSVAPVSEDYAHNARWGDHNGYSHLRSALVGTSKSFPVLDGEVHLGTWQQIILCDFDDRPREREITVTVTGD
jgi:secondary thiamine-phosphate synthase enzyme